MAEIHDRLRTLLESAELHKALAEVFYSGIEAHGGFDGMDLADHIRRARDFSGLYMGLYKVFLTHVIEKLPAPSPITANDLVSFAVAHLAGFSLAEAKRSEAVSLAVQRFVTFSLLAMDTLQRGEKEFYLGENWEHPRGDCVPFVDDSFNTNVCAIWSSPTGFELRAVGRPKSELPYCGEWTAFGILYGAASWSAIHNAETKLDGLIQSVGRTVELCVVPGDSGEERYDRNFKPFAFLSCGDGNRILSTCLSTHFDQLQGASTDTLLNRIHNAVVLLSQADRIESEPISLSLSFAAIEALVNEENELSVNKQVKRHVATLLVQDGASRKAKEKVIDKLYDIRSNVLHGTKVDASPSASEAVRRIAAGVIRAVTCWRENQQRVGGDTTWKELLDELNAASRKPAIVVGVPDLSELIPDKVPS